MKILYTILLFGLSHADKFKENHNYDFGGGFLPGDTIKSFPDSLVKQWKHLDSMKPDCKKPRRVLIGMDRVFPLYIYPDGSEHIEPLNIDSVMGYFKQK